MKVTILQKKLKNGLNIVERISQKSLTLPVLNNVLISTKENFLNLQTTDLEAGINWWGLAKIEKQGKIAVPVGILTSLISFLPEKPLSLSSDKNTLTIECEKHLSRIKGTDPEDFPLIPKIEKKVSVTLKAVPFCQSLAQIVDIAVPSLARPAISGVYLSFQGNLLKMVATDSFRLGEKKLYLKEPLEQEFSLILPQRAVKEIINIFGEREEEIKVYLAENQILFEALTRETSHPEIHFTSKLIEGEYPNYQEIIPQGYKTQIVLARAKFLNQIKTASLFSGKINEVKFSVNPEKGQIEILSQSPEAGDYRSSLLGEIKGEGLELSFNHRFLTDGLSKIKSSEVIFELNGEEGPGVLKPVEDQTYLYIVMPIKPS